MYALPWLKVGFTQPNMYITIRLPFVLRYFCRSIGIRVVVGTPRIETFKYGGHVMRGTLSVWPKCSRGSVSQTLQKSLWQLCWSSSAQPKDQPTQASMRMILFKPFCHWKSSGECPFKPKIHSWTRFVIWWTFRSGASWGRRSVLVETGRGVCDEEEEEEEERVVMRRGVVCGQRGYMYFPGAEISTKIIWEPFSTITPQACWFSVFTWSRKRIP